MSKYSRIKDLREDLDMTQKQMGDQLHISQRVYSHYESGTRAIPVEVLIQLADMYDVNLDYLVNRTDKKERI